MSAYLNPSSQLGFTRPLSQTITRTLTITNPNELPIAFKVKTTAPKLYCVRPNSGRVEPNQSVDVSVILQPMKEEPPLNAKCKDKFLIQTTLITPERESLPIGDLWTGPETDDATKIHQQKLRVVYLPAEGVPIPEDAAEQPSMTFEQRFDTIRDISTNGHPAAPEPQRVSPSPPAPERAASPAYLVAQEETTTTTQIHPSSPTRPPPVPAPEPRAPSPIPAPIPVSIPAPEPVPEPIPVPVPAPPTTSLPETDDLTNRYADALAEIGRLRALLTEAQQRATAAVPPIGVRRRTTRVVSEDGDTLAPEGSEDEEGTLVDSLAAPQAEGVPVHIVAGIAFAVFLATYLFF
ncbi:PapD-like protein [Cantharellus anzutake]|uniref:PapD-like protein n=1 Tax=Cantharellus anzutake TaxID=1750568 RepID=UPI0019053636|nr:PapD-like protein [Cantharellus anzutake]KAF8333524.1 PapD-like protein [Cantharellus anzutake]